jgi:mannose-6-phosphate isomerase-like protein (cupin superfamily)
VSKAGQHPIVVKAGEGKHLNVMGIEFTYKATGSETGSSYAFAEGLVAPHRGAPLHVHHREDEAFYVLDGEFEIECNGQVYKATPGTFALLPKDLPHRFQNLTDRPGKLLCVQSPAGIEEFFEHLSLLATDGGADPARLTELARRYDIDFFPPKA